MKKTFMMIASLVVLAACGGGGEKEKAGASTDQKTEGSGSALSDNPDYQKGLAIVSQSDCFTCHKIDEKNIGPAWRDVANKYQGQDTAVRYLAAKIIAGGAGVWGQVPMAAHPLFTQDDAEAVAKYVLLLKTK